MSRSELLQSVGRTLLKIWAVGAFALDDARLRGVRVPDIAGRVLERIGEAAVVVWRAGVKGKGP